LTQLSAGKTTTGKFREETDLDGREEDLGAPKAEGGLQN
jgi:hypothetical protein